MTSRLASRSIIHSTYSLLKSNRKICNPLLSTLSTRSYHISPPTNKKVTHEEGENFLNEYLNRHKNKLGEVIEPDEDGLITMNNNGQFSKEEIQKMIADAEEEVTKEEEARELRRRMGGGKHGFPKKELRFAHDMLDYAEEEVTKEEEARELRRRMG